MISVHKLIFRDLSFYWRTQAAVFLGVATAVAVLSGALLVGDSVRGSLRALVLERLGRTDTVIFSDGFVREQLGEDLGNDTAFIGRAVAPIILAQGFVSVQGGDGRAGKVLLYGVDERFWAFHDVRVDSLEGRDVLISPALAAELDAQDADTLLVRMQRPSDIPLESLHSRKDDAARAIRVTVRATLPKENLGEFSLQAQQGSVRALFLPLTLLQRELDVASNVNAFLISGTENVPALETLIRQHAAVEDSGLRLREFKSGTIIVESPSGVIKDSLFDAVTAVADAANLDAHPLFSYLANGMRVDSREVPYSLVTAVDSVRDSPGDLPAIELNEWAARDLNARPGDTLSMEYLLWEEPGLLTTKTTEFRVSRIVPIANGDPDMVPVYPGITDTSSLTDWDPPFPIDLRRIRPIDEDYWDRYRTTPKAFVSLETGRSLWGSRHGNTTSIRLSSRNSLPADALLPEIRRRLQDQIDPLQAGLVVQAVRTQSLGASRGATNFGEYFVYFSFFLVISALLLTALFFKLNVEQRIREVGLLRAVGLPPSMVRRIFLYEGLCIAVLGAVVGSAGGVVYAVGIIAALRSWWIGAVGTQSVGLHVSWVSIAVGAVSGVLAAVICIRLTLRGLQNIPERALLAGQLEKDSAVASSPRSLQAALVLLAAGFGFLIAGISGLLNLTAAFFGGGFVLLAGTLFFLRYRFGRPSRVRLGVGSMPVLQLGIRNAMFRPIRSVVAIATIASATFILIAVDSFRKSPSEEGFGGYNVLAESLVPVAYDPNSPEGQERLGLTDTDFGPIEAFRVRPGDDASCLNLYEPQNPKIAAPSDNFVRAGKMSFQSSLANTAEERANPWLLLYREEPDGAIPVIADANSMTYVLHRKLGEDFVLTNRGEPVRLRFVASLSDSVFQSEVLMSAGNFRRLFPEQEGYSLFLISSSAGEADSVARRIEQLMADYGVDATTSAARLAEFHRVENTYLSTFQMLGGLGLLLGTAGLAAVLLRNIFERRRELALLRAFGYTPAHFLKMTLVENGLLLGGGLVTGAISASLPVAPAIATEGGHFPGLALFVLLAVMLVLGILVSVLSTRVALREALLSALRSE